MSDQFRGGFREAAPQARSECDLTDLKQFEDLARTVFGFQSLRPDQREALSIIISHPRSLVTIPTGGGKSLLYGLLAMSSSGLTVVVSPLTALKREQAQLFRKVGICAAHLSFDQEREEREAIWAQLRQGQLKLLFVSPERFVSESFQSRLRESEAQGFPLSCLFVDEAHCMATWGYGFRPEYRQIGDVLISWKRARVVALTATAGRRTRAVITGILGGVTGELVSRPLRENIMVSVVRVHSERERENWLASLFENLNELRKVIVYVQRRADAERYAQLFRKPGIRTICYHAGLQARERSGIEGYIRASREPLVIFATQAYGMGIDLPEVDHVIVCGYPSGIEELIQMLGRSGRSGTSAKGTMLWNGADPVRRMHSLRRAHPLATGLSALLLKWQKDCFSRFGGLSLALQSLQELEGFLSRAQGLSPNPPRSFGGNHISEGEVWTAHEFSNVLRLGGVIEEIEVGTPMVGIILTEGNVLLEARRHFGAVDSQRARVLAAIADRLVSKNHLQQATGQTPFFSCMSLYTLQLKTQLSISQLERVFLSLNESFEQMKIQIFTSAASGGAKGPLFLSAPSILDVDRTLMAYEELRAERMSGFQILDQFARSTSCRLQSVFFYFDGKSHSPCGQCDLCMENRIFETQTSLKRRPGIRAKRHERMV